jgi:uncharacterized membrane-anchored protein
MKPLLLVVLALAPLSVFAAKEPTPEQIAQFREKRHQLAESLKPQQGVVHLRDGIATVKVPESLRFLDPQDTDTVLVKIWGNPPSPEKRLGMLIPANKLPDEEDSWAVVLTFEEDGYVKDDDASKINYNDLLKQMQDGTREASKKRVEQGYGSMELIGWATTPRYDSQAKKLYWAKELCFNGNPNHTLNYDLRVLGRRGVLSLNAIAGMDQLPEIEKATSTILGAVDFNEGHRYADYKAGTDKIATYGLVGLIAGGVLAKAGFFKILLTALLAAKKLVIVGAAAVVAGIKKLFGRKQNA